MWGGQKGQLKVRDNHLVDEKTSRDLMGVSRGRCLGCSSCGKYIIYTKDKYYRKVGCTLCEHMVGQRALTVSCTQGEDAPLHPDCDPSIMNCSRCSCAADQHEIDVAATERENGNDAVAIGDYDSAIVHYSKALEVNPVDPKIWSNRSKCYCAKRWWSQALYDANRGVSLDPTWYKLHYRKAVALKGLGHLQEALGACTTALSCLEQSKDDSRDASRAIQQLIRDLNSRIGVQNSKHSESQKRNRPLQESDRKTSENKGTVESKSTLTDYDGKAELECIRSSIERMQDQINFISEWISKHACPHAPREELIDIRNRLDKIESHLETSDCTEECVACGSDDEGDKAGDPTKASDGESISRTSSSMSDLSDTIAMIENAWKIKLDFQETISNATTDSDTRDCESPHKDSGDDKNSSSTSSSQESSDRTSQTLSEREKRVLRAKERREKAEKAGECMMTTSQDMLTQTKRMGCKICGPSCPEFKIYYQNEDVHDPEVMFYCSECGCRSEDHEIDQAYEKARQEKAEMEEQRARIRAARMRARNSEGFSKMQEAYATLGIQRGCSVDEIKSAYRALAKRYHPDKQKGRHIREQDIVRRQHMFTKSTEAYRYLIEQLG